MNRLIKNALCLTALVVTTAAVSSSTVVPYLQFRSQGFNAARELVGWQTQINRPEMCNFYGSFSITPEYMKSFKPCRLAQYLFGPALIGNCGTNCNTSCNTGCNDNCNWDGNSSCQTSMIKIQGANVANRDAKALLANLFYLPSDYSSEVTFKPTIDNFLVDFNLYLGLDNWAEGLYFRVHMPVVYSRWDLKFCENVISAGTQPADVGRWNDTYVPPTLPLDPSVYGLARSQMVASFQDYVSNGATITGVTGVTYNGLNKARMSSCKRHKTAVAEFTAAFGWNFVNCPDYTFGLNIRAAAPTGNRPVGEYLFEPIVGQGKHWELGGGLDARWVWWRSCDEARDFTVYLDANVTHLFKTRQCRTFDLCNKPLSRYMLAMKFTNEVSNLLAGPTNVITNLPVAPSYQFAKEFTPLANLTTLPVDVSAAVQGEIALKFAYTHCNWQFDFGYDFWGRSCEKICKRCDCATNGFKDNTWGLYGGQYMFGFQTATGPIIASQGTPLSGTASNATVFYNPNIQKDNATLAWYPTSPTVINPLETHVVGDSTGGIANWSQVTTSLQPVLIKESDLDVDGARAKSMSNKVFAHLGYVWKDCECWTPYLGIGGEAEFGMCDKNCNDNCNKPCNTSCNTSSSTSSSSSCSSTCKTSCGDNNTCCKSVALSQWGVWVKGGFSFN